MSLKLADDVAHQSVTFFPPSSAAGNPRSEDRLRSLATILTWLSDLQSKELESERANKQSSSSRIENLSKNLKRTRDAADIVRVRSTHASLDACLAAAKNLRETTEGWASQRSTKVESDYCITSLLLNAIEKSSSLNPSVERGLLDARVVLSVVGVVLASKGKCESDPVLVALRSSPVLNPDLVRAAMYLALIETEVDPAKGAKGLALMGTSWTRSAFAPTAPRFLRDPYFVLGLLLRAGHGRVALGLCVDMSLSPSKLDEAKILLRAHSASSLPRTLALARAYADVARSLPGEDATEWLLHLVGEAAVWVWKARGHLNGDLELLATPLLSVLECDALEKAALRERGSGAAGFIAALRLAHSRALPPLSSVHHAPSTRVEALMMIRQKSDTLAPGKRARSGPDAAPPKRSHLAYLTESTFQRDRGSEYEEADVGKFQAAMQPHELLKREQLHRALTQRPKMEMAEFRVDEEEPEATPVRPTPAPSAAAAAPAAAAVATPMQPNRSAQEPPASLKRLMLPTTLAGSTRGPATAASLKERLAASSRASAAVAGR